MSRLSCIFLAAMLNALLLARLESYWAAIAITLSQISGAAIAGKSASPLLLLRREGRFEFARSPFTWGGAQIGLLLGALLASSILPIQSRQQTLTLATGSLFLYLGLARIQCINAGCCNWTALESRLDTRVVEIFISIVGFLSTVCLAGSPSTSPMAKYFILFAYITFRSASLLLQRRQFKLSNELPLLLLAATALAAIELANG